MSGKWNFKKFEANIEREFELRRNLERREAPQMVTDNLLFDIFLIVGLPPKSKEKNAKPAILFAYPPFENPEISLDHICDHCLPTGPKRQFLDQNKGQFIKDEFCIRLKSSWRQIHGVCVHVDPKYAPNLPFYASKETRSSTFCLCFLTGTPVLGAHFSFVTYLALWSVGLLREPHEFEGMIAVEMPPGVPIAGLDLANQYGFCPSIQVPPHFVDEIANYYTSPLTAPPMKFGDGLELRFPPRESLEAEKPVLWASLDTLFSLITPAEVVRALCGLMLDGQVLVMGKCLEEVTMVVYALLGLMMPLRFLGQIIPVLPSSPQFMELLNSPTPFIIGTAPSPALSKFVFLDSLIIIDLDKRQSPPVAFYPKFPLFDVIVAQTTEVLNQKGPAERNVHAFPEVFNRVKEHKVRLPMSAVEKILTIMQQPFNNIYTEYLWCFFVTEMSTNDKVGVTVFNQELFMAQVSPADAPFYDLLMESLSFQEYIENRITQYMKMRGESTKGRRRSSFSSNSMISGRARSSTRRKSIQIDDPEEASQFLHS